MIIRSLKQESAIRQGARGFRNNTSSNYTLGNSIAVYESKNSKRY